MNPILRSRIRTLIGRRKNYLHERDDMSQGTRTASLVRLNQEIITEIDRSLYLMGASPQSQRKRGYRVKKVLKTDQPGEGRAAAA